MKVILYKLDTPGNPNGFFRKEIELHSEEDLPRIAGCLGHNVYMEVVPAKTDSGGLREGAREVALGTSTKTASEIMEFLFIAYNGLLGDFLKCIKGCSRPEDHFNRFMQFGKINAPRDRELWDRAAPRERGYAMRCAMKIAGVTDQYKDMPGQAARTWATDNLDIVNPILEIIERHGGSASLAKPHVKNYMHELLQNKIKKLSEEELEKLRDDPIYFIETVLKIGLSPIQRSVLMSLYEKRGEIIRFKQYEPLRPIDEPAD